MICPRCTEETQFKAEKYESVEIDRCTRCKGVWLDHAELLKIVTIKEEKFSPKLVETVIQSAFKGVPDREEHRVEVCPKCDHAMDAMNYDFSSGIIIDKCPQSHGFWLDHEEIEKLQAHREHWEKQAQQNKKAWINLVKSAGKADQAAKAQSGQFFLGSILGRILR